ncbi:MarR family winged helix-turn-helix transcriptional regulator [Virgisporangium ochraceum]|uniref:MarR family transcriptional regulator n=1 Tax=Virgisporangium ochraceum TaxID=65505 RepID=A0A8J4EB91_9ACTN|nr:MarR family transcriptional regulator [Virgisporangium ochraceum]GIJ65592.1 MarR family transcriptional regulator [Virgisporangium ochraceum]
MMIKQAARRSSSAAPLASALRDAIMRLNRRLRQARPVGDLTMSQISALTTLGFAGALSPRELAEQERVQPPTMTKIVAKLEERGLVQRTPHPTDGRQVVLSATEVGRAAVVEHRRAGDAWLAEAIGELSAEDRQTLRRAAELLNTIARSQGGRN